MPHSKLRPNYLFDEEKIDELKRIAPEAFTDGKINWDVLKENLGEYLDDLDEENELFGLNWPGKKQARKIASIPSKGTLAPVEGEGINEGNTKNIFIEGENLEVLKILQKSYAGRVKMIYIDPPYNTGNDFVYDDNFKEPLQEYLRRTGQIDEEGKPLTTNTRADGRFHSKWLSMMYPRLRLSRSLLSDDGMIFVSIDDNEVHNLRQIMNEIFGEENFITQFIWKKRSGGGYSNTIISTNHEYIVLYSKTEFVKINDKEKSGEWIQKYYTLKDDKGYYKRRDVRKSGTGDRREDRPTMFYPIVSPDGKNIFPQKANGDDGRWTFSENTFKELLSQNEIEFVKNEKGWKVYYKERSTKENGEIKGEKYESILTDLPINTAGTKEIENIFGDKNYFSFPKPTGLIKHLIKIGSNEDDLIIDFFAGSGSTGQAILDLNNEQKANRRFIVIQMPEEFERTSEAFKNDIKNISELSKERIRRVINKIRETELLSSNLGFKVYRLKPSNFKGWHDCIENELSEVTSLFEKTTNPLIEGWKKEHVLSEIILIEGFPLDSTIEEDKSYKNNKIILVRSEYHEHKLIVCLDKTIREETIKNFKINDNDIFICFDSAITDNDKVVLADKGIIKTI